MRPTRDHRAGHPVPARPCSRWGLASRRGHPPRWWSLTPPFHPCLCRQGGHRRSALCSTFRRVAPPGGYPAPCPVESGLSSTPAGAAAARRAHLM